MPQDGREVVIVEAVRTPIGRGHKEKGYYKDTHPNELLGRCYSEVIERAGIDAGEVEDVVAGCVQQYGEQMFNVGAQRLAAGRAAGRDAGHHRRPPVRLGPAGGQLRGGADRRRRARRGRSAPASSTWATCRWAIGFNWVDRGRHARGRRS